MTAVVMNNMTTISLTLYISDHLADRIKALKAAAKAGSFLFLLVLLTRSAMQCLQSCPPALCQLLRKCVMYLWLDTRIKWIIANTYEKFSVLSAPQYSWYEKKGIHLYEDFFRMSEHVNRESSHKHLTSIPRVWLVAKTRRCYGNVYC